MVNFQLLSLSFFLAVVILALMMRAFLCDITGFISR